MKTTLDFALQYARSGYKVMPLIGKIPRISRGAHGATCDETKIRRWWTRWPDANIGITLAGLVVVDIDPRNGGDVTHLAHELPTTCMARTGGGGLHYLYRARPDSRYPGKLASGIDQKSGAGAYIVVEPSLHDSGKRYEWENTPLAWQPTEAPEWLAGPAQSPVAHRLPVTQKTDLSQWIVIQDGDDDPFARSFLARVPLNRAQKTINQ